MTLSAPLLTYSERVERGYSLASLQSLLRQIRAEGRYRDAWGVNALTTANLGAFNAEEAKRELAAAADAGRLGNSGFQPKFANSASGLSHGLNPYTDWTMSLLDAPPRHTYLFLGLDFYDIADLGRQADWNAYLQNPFMDRDPFWHRLWAWIMDRTEVNSNKRVVWQTGVAPLEAARFVKADGGAFIFHNLIPYLRPAGVGSTEKDWPSREWNKLSVQADIVEDLRLLRDSVRHPIRAYCTSAAAIKALTKAGFNDREVVCWSAHPSKVFYPSTLYPRGLHFKKI
ncbi:hypothetical protein ACFQ09_26010 [Massilia norwichensis]|uniref:Uncharacterized protein n=1 Tax=Massilia norwichensis TaxID=1442366 RepID=A0ABT2AAQ7_9BURK|nr:hypothetical protein [Massilia norwichensis]MCS0591288.1 hypothetical protein [Massilia norwichensis]